RLKNRLSHARSRARRTWSSPVAQAARHLRRWGKVDDEPKRTYPAGESWMEKRGDHHQVGHNASNTEPAKLQATFVVDTSDGKIVIPGQVSMAAAQWWPSPLPGDVGALHADIRSAYSLTRDHTFGSDSATASVAADLQARQLTPRFRTNVVTLARS